MSTKDRLEVDFKNASSHVAIATGEIPEDFKFKDPKVLKNLLIDTLQ